MFDAARQHIVQLRQSGKRVMVAGWTEGASDRLASVLGEHGLAPIAIARDWSAVQGLPKSAIARVVLPLEQGFETDTLAVVAEQDILGDRLARRVRKRKNADFITEAGSLSAGDLVVHSDHGLGRYLGLKTLTVQGAPHDCLELEYAGAAKLFLPVENIELLSRYGNDSETAQLDKLGGVAWQARKAKAKKNACATWPTN